MSADQNTHEPADNRVAANDDSNRSGLDARRRGWFWHWNNVVTQYAPLIGLKGVGLLNSYTVWTDRRDESPHRGYAFPSQQSEADFYGEERAELITINKILVALDLIEIRKEMLTRADERGRRWRVPHNLYRVKDRPDGVDLRALDVLRVAELAKKDQAVFRYVRRVFSDRFKPIDGDNVWQKILEDLRDDTTWRELQERTRAIEARASARTRAGHKSRSGASAAKSDLLDAPDGPITTSPPSVNSDVEGYTGTADTASAALRDTQQTGRSTRSRQTSVATINTGLDRPERPDVEQSNEGSDIDVAETNTGLTRKAATSAAGSNTARPPVVGPGNTTYDQEILTTTTTTTSASDRRMANGRTDSNGVSVGPSSSVAPLTTKSAVLIDDAPQDNEDSLSAIRQTPRQESGNRRQLDGGADVQAIGRGWNTAVGGANQIDDGDRVDERMAGDSDTAVVAYGAAVDQQVGEGNDDARRASGTNAGGSAGEWRLVGADGGGPLVDPGPLVLSTFEAANDRRATGLERSLLAELEQDADPAARAVGSTGADWVVAAMREAVSSGSAFVAPKRIREILTRWARDPRDAPSSAPPNIGAFGSPLSAPADAALPETAQPDVRLPGGASGNLVWSVVLADLSRLLDRDAFDRLLAGSRIARYWRGTVDIQTTNPAAADKLSKEYRAIVERHLNSRLSKSVAVRFEVTPPVASADPEPPALASSSPSSERLVVAEADVEIGRQVWQSLLSDLSRTISPADLDRLAGVIVLGQDASGTLLLGAPSPLAQRLLSGRYRAHVESSLAALLSQPAPVRVLSATEWTIDPTTQ